MALLKYLTKKDGPLPNPNGTLSEHIKPSAILECNKKVSELTKIADSPKSTPKRGKYSVYSPQDRALIGRYASENGPVATMRKYKTEYPDLKESTVSADVHSNTSRFRRGSEFVNLSCCLAVGHAIVTASDKQLLSEFGGPITLTKSWAASLLKRMNYVKRRGSCTAKTQISDEKFKDLKEGYLTRIDATVHKHKIPPELIYNWDHTGINYVPVSNWTMAVEGSKKVPIVGLDDKRQITVVFAGTLAGDFIPPQVIYQGLTEACHAQYDFPLAWNITHSPNHWANQQTQSEYTRKIVLPHIKKTKKSLGLPENQKALCIFDVFRAQMGEDFIQELKDNGIEIVYVPASCTDRLQPMDLSVQKVVKDKMKQRFQAWYSKCICKQLENGTKVDELVPVDLRLSVMKPLAAKWLHETYSEIKADRRLVYKGFEKAGIAEAVDFSFEYGNF